MGAKIIVYILVFSIACAAFGIFVYQLDTGVAHQLAPTLGFKRKHGIDSDPMSYWMWQLVLLFSSVFLMVFLFTSIRKERMKK